MPGGCGEWCERIGTETRRRSHAREEHVVVEGRAEAVEVGDGAEPQACGPQAGRRGSSAIASVRRSPTVAREPGE